MYQMSALAELGHSGKVNDTCRQLNALNDEQLSDIGLSCGQIDDVARGFAARVRPPH